MTLDEMNNETPPEEIKGMNKRIWAALRLKMEGIEHELHKMG